MSTFEQRLQEVNLTPFKNAGSGSTSELKEKLFKDFVKQLWKYQYFRNEVILEKINKLHYSDSTIKNLMASLRVYIATGKKTKRAYKGFYESIDEFKGCFEPTLTPSKYERHLPKASYKARKCVPDVSVPAGTLVKRESILERIEPKYGVLCEDKIRIFDSKEYCLGFIDCYKTVGDGKPVKLIKVDYEVVDEGV